MYPVIDEDEKQQIEWVFDLTGGELSDKPLRVAQIEKNPLFGAFRDEKKPYLIKRHWFRYFYDGAPEYVAREWAAKGGSYFTVVIDCLYGYPAHRIVTKDGRIWLRVATYKSSGEKPCPGRDQHECRGQELHPTIEEGGYRVSIVTEDEAKVPKGTDHKPECPLCGEYVGEAHGHIYLGDAWCEVVYRTRD